MLGPEDCIIERPVVGYTAPSNPPLNLLSHNRPFDAVGRTASVTCEPVELHFRGFVPGQRLQQTITLRNDSAAKTRVVVIPPTDDNFKVVSSSIGGNLAPGLCQHLTVEFCGQQLQQYQSNILIHTQDGGLAVPLHAYPSSGSPPLPKVLDLGTVPLGTTVHHQLPLKSTTGLSFGFEVTVLQHNRHFQVAPLTGIVPEHGQSVITIAFTPSRYSTEHMQMQVVLPEHGAEPMRTLVTASCQPGLAQQQLVEEGLKQQQQQMAVEAQQQHWQHREGASGCQLDLQGFPAGDQLVRTQQAGGGRRQRSVTDKPRALSKTLQLQHISQHDVNMLFNQRPGKLQIKDVKAAIAARKEELKAEQQHLQAALAAGFASGIDPLDQPDIHPDIKEALFQLLQRKADDTEADAGQEAAEQHASGTATGISGGCVGSIPPTSEELERMAVARAAALASVQARKEEAARHRLSAEVEAEGAVCILESTSSTHQVGNYQHHQQQEQQQQQQTSRYPGLEGFRPQWLLLSEGNDWRKRVQVAQRFVNVARVVIYRNRAQARLRKLRALAASLRDSRHAMAGRVWQDVVVEGSVVRRPGLPPAQLMVPAKVAPMQLPLSCPLTPPPRHEVLPETSYAEFSALQPQTYQSEAEYKLLGYEPQEFPSLLPYVPLCQHQPLMPGTTDGLPGGMPVGLLPTSLYNREVMPTELLNNPYASCNHSSSTQFSPPLQCAGLEPENGLLPCVYQHVDGLSEPPGLNAVRSLATAAPGSTSDQGGS